MIRDEIRDFKIDCMCRKCNLYNTKMSLSEEEDYKPVSGEPYTEIRLKIVCLSCGAYETVDALVEY